MEETALIDDLDIRRRRALWRATHRGTKELDILIGSYARTHPNNTPDEIKFDEKGKKGKRGEIDQAELSAEQIQEVWMRRLQTTPSDFLRLKFAAQAEGPKTPAPQGKPRGER